MESWYPVVSLWYLRCVSLQAEAPPVRNVFRNRFLVVTPVLDKPTNGGMGNLGGLAVPEKNLAYPLDCGFSPMALELRVPGRRLREPG